jgi:hypothetical protein
MNYTVNYNLTRTQASGNTTVQISPLPGGSLPQSITVTNGTLLSWDPTTGIAVLSSANANTQITCECTEPAPSSLNSLVFYVNSHQATPFTLTMQGGKSWDGTLKYYDISNNQWNTWDGTAISGAWDGEKTVLYLKGIGNSNITNSGSSSTPRSYFKINSGSTVTITGNIENLLDWSMVANGQHPLMSNYAFSGLFYNNQSINTNNLICGGALGTGCFYQMFLSCGSSLTTPPILPETSLSGYCYYGMFMSSGISTPPALPATTLAAACYQSMFQNCQNLTSIPELSATHLPQYCYYKMFLASSNIRISQTSSSTYSRQYRIPSEGIGTTEPVALNDMFKNTGGTFKGTPLINTIYYTSNNIVPVSPSEFKKLPYKATWDAQSIVSEGLKVGYGSYQASAQTKLVDAYVGTRSNAIDVFVGFVAHDYSSYYCYFITKNSVGAGTNSYLYVISTNDGIIQDTLYGIRERNPAGYSFYVTKTSFEMPSTVMISPRIPFYNTETELYDAAEQFFQSNS